MLSTVVSWKQPFAFCNYNEEYYAKLNEEYYVYWDDL